MPDEKSPEPEITDRLFATYISPDRKVLDIDSFKAAFVKALSDAYEQGLQDGWPTRRDLYLTPKSVGPMVRMAGSPDASPQWKRRWLVGTSD